MTILWKATEQCFHVVLFVLCYSVGLTFQSVDQTMQWGHSLESYWTVLSCGAVCFVLQCGSNFSVCGSNHAVRPFFGKLLNSAFMWCCLFCATVWFLLFSLWIKPCCLTILWKPTEQCFHVVLFVLCYSVGLTFQSVDQTMQWGHSLESYWTVLSCGAVCFVLQCGSNFSVCGSNHAVRPFFGKLLNSAFMWCCLFCATVWFLLFSLWIKPCCLTILWKPTEQCFHVVLFVLCYSVVLTFQSVDQTMLCDHSLETYWTVL